jgi:hypothetical protein
LDKRSIWEQRSTTLEARGGNEHGWRGHQARPRHLGSFSPGPRLVDFLIFRCFLW